MKTSKLIDLLCTAISGCHEDIGLINGFVHDEGKIFHTNPEVATSCSAYTNVTSLIGCASEMVRELYPMLPESLQTESLTEKVGELYPHLMKKDWDAAYQLIVDTHAEIYAIWQAMHDAQSAVEVYS
jgi:hypothetical protein